MAERLARSRFLAGFGAAVASTGTARAQSAPPMRVGVIASDTYAEAFYAQDAGFFKQAGLDVEITTLANGTAILTGVLAGALDLGISNTVAIATAVSHGFPVGFIAAGAYYLASAPTTVLCVARDAPYRGARDLEGKTVAVSALRDMNAAGAKAWLVENGADLTRISFIEMSFPEMAPALAHGTIAAATIPEPQLTDDRRQIRVLADFFDVIGKRFMNGGWFTTPEYRAQNPALVRKFVATIYATAAWANAHHPQTAAILAKYSKVPLATTREMTRAIYAEALSPDIVQPSLDVAYKFKLLDRRVAAAEVILRG